MHTTISGKEKGKLVKIQPELLKKLPSGFKGALDMNYFYEGYGESDKKWFKARILACRLAQDFNATGEKNQSSYQYYIHFQQLDRKSDEWVPFNYLRKTGQEIKQEQVKKKGNKEKVSDKYTEHEGMDYQSLQVHLQLTKFKTIHQIQIGKYKCDAWYYSSYPIFYHNIECLMICQFCLNFYALKKQLQRHYDKCPLFHPPGDQIYRDLDQKIAVFEVDGLKNRYYCQNLSLLSKLFLDHKNLQYDTTVFLYYVLCQIVGNQYHLAGYFSKPKESNLNLSCILVLPFHQRKGYGKFLISLSYEFSLIQGKTGTPQKPLSDLGRQTYLSWWSQRLVTYLKINKNQPFTIEDIIKETAMTQEDILWTFQQTGILKIVNGVAHLCVQSKFLQQVYKNGGRQGRKVVKDYIHWIPFKIKWENQSLNY